MRTAMREKLVELYREYGAGLFDDAQRLRALLRDYFPGEQREIRMILKGVEHPIFRELYSLPSEKRHFAASRWIQVLHDEDLLSKEDATAVFRFWTQLLDRLEGREVVEESVSPLATVVTGEALRANELIAPPVQQEVPQNAPRSPARQSSGNLKTHPSAGDFFQLGRFPQTSISSPEPLLWRVLDARGGELLLLTESILIIGTFNDIQENNTWKGSVVRAWLNSLAGPSPSFLSRILSKASAPQFQTSGFRKAFSDAEWLLLSASDISEGIAGEAVTDKVFLLSKEETEKYMRQARQRSASCTQWALVETSGKGYNGGFLMPADSSFDWWLRSPAGVDSVWMTTPAGEFRTAHVGRLCGVRPAVRLPLSVIKIAPASGKRSDPFRLDTGRQRSPNTPQQPTIGGSAPAATAPAKTQAVPATAVATPPAKPKTQRQPTGSGTTATLANVKTTAAAPAPALPAQNTFKPIAGQYLYLGRFPQSGAKAAAEPVLWRILEARSGELLLLADAVLIAGAYDVKRYYNWQSSNARAWLNSLADYAQTGFRNAFTGNEWSALSSTVQAAGSGAADKVFLLSEAEVKRYLKTEAARRAKCTSWAADKDAKNGYTGGYAYPDSSGFCWWWLGAPDDSEDTFAPSVTNTGTFSKNIADNWFGLRPALWLRLHNVTSAAGKGTESDPYRLLL